MTIVVDSTRHRAASLGRVGRHFRARPMDFGDERDPIHAQIDLAAIGPDDGLQSGPRAQCQRERIDETVVERDVLHAMPAPQSFGRSFLERAGRAPSRLHHDNLGAVVGRGHAVELVVPDRAAVHPKRDVAAVDAGEIGFVVLIHAEFDSRIAVEEEQIGRQFERQMVLRFGRRTRQHELSRDPVTGEIDGVLLHGNCAERAAGVRRIRRVIVSINDCAYNLPFNAVAGARRTLFTPVFLRAACGLLPRHAPQRASRRHFDCGVARAAAVSAR